MNENFSPSQKEVNSKLKFKSFLLFSSLSFLVYLSSFHLPFYSIVHNVNNQNVHNGNQKVQNVGASKSKNDHDRNVGSEQVIKIKWKEKDLILIDFPSQNTSLKTSLSKCNFYKGEWIKNNNKKPLYDNRDCKIIQSEWLCQNQKRSNYGYLYYKWKPVDCELPVFDPNSFLNRMRNKVVAFMGDSLTQQHFKSLVCMLSTSRLGSGRTTVTRTFPFTRNSGSAEPNGLAYKFPKTNTVVLTIGNALLCKLADYVDENGKKRVAMHLDKPDDVLVKLFPLLDVVVVANGNHFNVKKIREGSRDYFLNGKKVNDQNSLSVGQATSIIITSMVKFLNSKSKVKNKKGRLPLLFFRSISLSHSNSGGRCDNIQQPLTDIQLKGRYSRDVVVEGALKNSRVTLLNITHMSLLRGDAHVVGSVQPGSTTKQDCRHWCMPGVPDAWNEILNAHLIAKGS